MIYKFINARKDLIKPTMTHEEIICYLWGKQIPQKFANVVPERVFDDFVQYCYIELLRIDPQRLTDLYNARKLDAFFFRLCKNQAINPRSMFYIHCGELPMLIGKVTFTPLDDRGGVQDEEE